MFSSKRLGNLLTLTFLSTAVLAAPLRADSPPPARRSLRTPLLWGTGLTMATLLVDKSIHREISIHDKNIINKVLGRERYGRQGTAMDLLGQPHVTMGVSAIFYGAGVWREDSRAKRVGKAGAAASLLAGGAALGIKWAVGRDRPYAGSDPDEYRPFRGDTTAKSSFPSGHSAVAFALASVIADEYDHWAVDGLSYGAASAVGLSRIYQDRHWASDIVGGATVGIVIGKWTRRRMARHDAKTAVYTDGKKLYLARRF